MVSPSPVGKKGMACAALDTDSFVVARQRAPGMGNCMGAARRDENPRIGRDAGY